MMMAKHAIHQMYANVMMRYEMSDLISVYMVGFHDHIAGHCHTTCHIADLASEHNDKVPFFDFIGSVLATHPTIIAQLPWLKMAFQYWYKFHSCAGYQGTRWYLVSVDVIVLFVAVPSRVWEVNV